MGSSMAPFEKALVSYYRLSKVSIVTFHLSLRVFRHIAAFVLQHVNTVTDGQLRKPQHTYVKRAVRKAHFQMNWTFKVIIPIGAGRYSERCVVVICN